jgi:hypothetical protein
VEDARESSPRGFAEGRADSEDENDEEADCEKCKKAFAKEC